MSYDERLRSVEGELVVGDVFRDEFKIDKEKVRVKGFYIFKVFDLLSY